MTPDLHLKGGRTKTGVFELYRTMKSLATEAREVFSTVTEFPADQTSTANRLSGGSAGRR
jgi:hypothetical protein